jgi:hypothetical protein
LVVPWLLIMAWNWVGWLRRPHRIDVLEDGTVVFVPKLGSSRVVHAQDIQAVRTAFWGNGEPVVRYRSGRIRLLHAYHGFDEFLRYLTAINPGIQTEGKELSPFP